MTKRGPADSIDLGHGVYMRWVEWTPDRALNPHLADLEDETPTGFIVGHVHDDGAVCEGLVPFDTPANRREGRNVWQVHSLDPLHVEPSILRRECGLHGFVREGRWVPA